MCQHCWHLPPDIIPADISAALGRGCREDMAVVQRVSDHTIIIHNRCCGIHDIMDALCCVGSLYFPLFALFLQICFDSALSWTISWLFFVLVLACPAIYCLSASAGKHPLTCLLFAAPQPHLPVIFPMVRPSQSHYVPILSHLRQRPHSNPQIHNLT